MELNLADNERMSHSHSNHSILSVMKGFIDAVNEMDETVLIPSRLMDMQAEPKTLALQQNAASSTKSQDMAVIPASCAQDSVSLHACYAMLKAVKSELVRGPIPEEDRLAADDDDDDKENIGTDKNRSLEEATARAFREHLIGLFSILQQLTNVSKKLTTKYQEELGDYQSCFKPKSSSSLLI
ncbi:mid1-interacting protein 1A-like [Acanthaster planci]|uniref:Mid1-interacting protein 1A-like n=1 Tax=Acanthaster planci TaxID=133434 RepID=A0A8B7Y8T8_ACAPL|nr:mid1-interacting protein 1A-like [Acanthaster planci]